MTIRTMCNEDGCKFIAKRETPIALEEARKRYEPCSVCNPPKVS